MGACSYTLQQNSISKKRDIFGYYSRPSSNKGALKWSWVWTNEHGLLTLSILQHANITTYPNHGKVPDSGETDM